MGRDQPEVTREQEMMERLETQGLSASGYMLPAAPDPTAPKPSAVSAPPSKEPPMGRARERTA